LDPSKDKFDYTDQHLWDSLKKTHDVGNVTGLGDTPNRADAVRAYNEGTVGVQTKEQLQKLGLGDSDFVHKVGPVNAAAGLGELDVSGRYSVIAAANSAVAGANRMLLAQPAQNQILGSVLQQIFDQKQVTPELAQQYISVLKSQTYAPGTPAAQTLERNFDEMVHTTDPKDLPGLASSLGIPIPPGFITGDPGKDAPKLEALIKREGVDGMLTKAAADQFKTSFGNMPFTMPDGSQVPTRSVPTNVLMSSSSSNPQLAGPRGRVNNPPISTTQPTMAGVTNIAMPGPPGGNVGTVAPPNNNPPVTFHTEDFSPGPNAPKELKSSDDVMYWLLSNPTNAKMPLSQLIANATKREMLSPKMNSQ